MLEYIPAGPASQL